MKILITGINGQVGHALMQQLTEYELVGLTRQDCDLTNPDQIKRVIDQHQPDLIINPAAYTKVDQAEDEPELAFQINRDAPKVMAEKAREYDIPFIHFSTDYVFDGKKEGGYMENDKTYPLGVYGSSKLAGEEAVQDIGGQIYIFRTSWVYSRLGSNFYQTINRLAQEKTTLNIVSDQFGVPTSAYFIANQLADIINRLSSDNVGIYHLVPNDSCSWYDFAYAILKKNQPKFMLNNLVPINTSEYPTKALRPMNSILNNGKFKKTFMVEFNSWQNELLNI